MIWRTRASNDKEMRTPSLPKAQWIEGILAGFLGLLFFCSGIVFGLQSAANGSFSEIFRCLYVTLALSAVVGIGALLISRKLRNWERAMSKKSNHPSHRDNNWISRCGRG